ncbi:prolyl oligopeptidase family serine peptidase [Duganella sp. FT80W]|uniref:Prolyl oligopeptidase family serine peptidase n=1 Tax=Duganella guangzhouensis TaxID=2666084 RepID=A0A6I2KWH4_9BURK|nr:alpha/beta fold hydrolase [Duganella guangzhouensis]MRW88556.1 prolyl oligopeptidase family serine peptidase [Duganella guangzhouensis]
MFQYFPTNYVWSLAVNAALESGGRIGEIDEVCRPLRDLATQGDDPGTEAFFQAWVSMGEKLVALAEEDKAEGHFFSAGEKLDRAVQYFACAERMQAHSFAPRKALYSRYVALFQQAQDLMGARWERVEIPYGDEHLAGVLFHADGKAERQPLMLCVNGLDSTKEMLARTQITRQLNQRGIACLYLDQPGTGEALRLHDMPAMVNSEVWASKVVDYLEARTDVDPKRIGMMGVSLGGYYTPRAVAFEPRFAIGAVWGANHNWGEMQKRRLLREGENPVPHYWEHVRWVWGADNMDDFMAKAEQIHLNGILDRVRVPFLVTHGEQDRQIPLEYAHQTYDQLVNSPQRKLKIFTDREGGVHHVSLDNMANAGAFIADWIAGQLGGKLGPAV